MNIIEMPHNGYAGKLIAEGFVPIQLDLLHFKSNLFNYFSLYKNC
jgi:hypothetical protein